MSFRKIFLSLLIAVPALSISDDVGFYVVSSQFVKHLSKYVVKSPLQVVEGRALVTLTVAERDDLVNEVHENQNFCAGVTDVTDDYLKSEHKESFLSDFVAAQEPKLISENFEIRHEAQAKALMAFANEQAFEAFITKYIQFPDRYGNSSTGQEASQYLKKYLGDLAARHNRSDIVVGEVVTGKGYLQNSVFAKIPGTDSGLPGVLMGGHMDTLKNSKPGADDDASGTTVVAEVYRAILESGLRFKRDIYLAFYAAEEVGLVGSGVMAKKFKSEGIELRGVLQFDMVGYRSQAESLPMHFVEDNVSDELTRFTKDLAIKYLGLRENELGTVNCNYECSDHASWNRQGYPSAFPFESSMNNMNRKIHTAKDTMDTVNVNHALQFVRLGSAWAAEMAEAN